MGLPLPGEPCDTWGGSTIEIRQCDFGHPCEKLTWLYRVRCHTPAMPVRREPTHVIKPQRNVARALPICMHKWREATPIPLAWWLLQSLTKFHIDGSVSFADTLFTPTQESKQMHKTIFTRRCGEQNTHCYTLVPIETLSIYGSGRPGWGVKFQSDPSRWLISDEIVWFETSAADRDAFIAAQVSE